MSKGIKTKFNTLFVISLALLSLNACQKRIETANGQLLYDPNEETYSYAGQTSGVSAQNSQDKKAKIYQSQQQEILDLYNKNQNVNPDSSQNIDENYYYAGQTSSNWNNQQSQTNKSNNKKNDTKNNDTNVIAPVVLSTGCSKSTSNSSDPLSQLNKPTKSADGKYTYVPNAKQAGIQNTSTDNIITDNELNKKLYDSMDGKFKKSKLEQLNKKSGVYSNKEDIISGKTTADGSSPGIPNSSSAPSVGGSSAMGSSVGGDVATSSAGSANSSASSGLSAGSKAAIGTSVGAGGASLGASGASLASNLLGKGTPDLLGKSGSNSLGKGKDISQNAKNKAKEQQKKDDKERQQNKKLYIQVNRYNNAQWAQKVLKELRKGYPNASSRTEGTQTVLLVGPYPNKLVGQAVKAKLISEGFTGAFFVDK